MAIAIYVHIVPTCMWRYIYIMASLHGGLDVLSYRYVRSMTVYFRGRAAVRFLGLIPPVYRIPCGVLGASYLVSMKITATS